MVAENQNVIANFVSPTVFIYQFSPNAEEIQSQISRN